MSADDSTVGRDEPLELQFDRVETTTPHASASALPQVTCAICGKSVGAEYYHANGKPICDACRHLVTAAAKTPRSIGSLLLAGLFGLGAAIAGAGIYYAVVAFTRWELAIVAIVIGYMVGWAVRRGAGGRGGRRFQILAVALTYWAVGLAYASLTLREAVKEKRDKSASVAADSTTKVTPSATTDSAQRVTSSAEKLSGRSAVLAAGGLFLLVFALPVLAVFGSLPSGLISAIIIFVGLLQAWTMTGKPKLDISGPYRVGTGPPA